QVKLSEGYGQHADENVPVTVALGYRYLKEEEGLVLHKLLEEDYNFLIQNIQSEVVSKAEVDKWRDENEVKAICRTIRSGQVLSVNGDLLLVGNVNPGGTIKATGSIYVIGKMLGIAHAGSEG